MQTITKYFWLTLVFSFLSVSSIFSQVNADFSATPTTGCAPVFVQFTDLSTSSGNITSWSWQLGGTNATAQNPGKAFTTGGTYTICLTVTDDQGNTDTECKTNYISLFDSPQAQLTATPTTGCSPLAVQFTDNSNVGTGAIALYQWAFGDGNSASGSTVNNNYIGAGDYDVTLSVTDVNGCSNVVTLQDHITVQDIGIVDFIASTTEYCDTPFTVTFTDLTPPNPNLTYSWDFGDGNVSTQQNPTHTYTTFGNFQVSVTVTDPISGCSKTKNKNNYIKIGSSLAFTYSPASGCEPSDVNFVNTTPGTSSNWSWDFGDGNSSTQENPTHTYTTDGCYFVTLTATKNGCTSTITSPSCIQINDAPQPSYTLNGSNLACSIPHAVSFTGTSNLPGSTFAWDFGDGNTSTQQNPAHTYITFGVFPVSLTAISAQGCSTTVVLDTVKIQSVVADFSVDTIEGCSPLDVTFSDESFSLFPITSYNWNIVGGAFSGTYTTSNPTVTLTDTAVYDMTLTITNSQGCSDNITITEIVKVGNQPVIDFFSNDTIVCVDTDVIFTNNSSTWTDFYNWDFGDGGTSVATNPTYMYADTGFYDVELKATHNGCFSIVEKTAYVEVQPAKSDFTIVRNCNTPYVIDFINQSIGGHRYHWDFGVTTATDDTSNVLNPVFMFPDRGTYVVNLTAYNDSTGCVHDFSETITITDPISNFAFSSDSGCAPLNIQITNSSVDGSLYNWIVPGANISDATSPSPIIQFEDAGVYSDYKLIITDLNGCLDTITFNDTIQVYDVYPAINADTLSCPDTPVSFTDISTTSDGNITNWSWDLGNGQTSTLQNPTMTYVSQDTFSIALTVTNTLGCVRTDTFTNYMQITEPNVSFTTVDTFVCAGQDVNFANASDGNGRPIGDYLWDFGDGNTSTVENPVHQYMSEGVYDICLTVTDTSGCNNTFCITSLVHVVNPQAEFAADSLQASCPILVTNFADSSFNAIGWSWDFGDGIGTSTIQNPSYTYVTSGSFDVRLVVTDINGCKDTLTKPSYISIDGPYGNFSATPLNACPNSPVTFTGNGFNSTRYIWDYGDGNFDINNTTDTIDIQPYSYTSGGTYFPILILEGSQGCVEVIPSTTPIVVDNLNAMITASDTFLCDTATVLFTPTFLSNLPIDSFYWDFNGVVPNSTDTIPSVFFSTPGVYPVTLHYSNATCSNFTTINITAGRNPQANFAAVPILGCTPQLVNFQNTSNNNNSYAGDTINSWNWVFDYQGFGDTLANTSFTYIDSGDYNIQLIVGSLSGCYDTTITQIRINLSPTANAGQDQTVCLQNAVQLNGSGDGSYQWSNAATLDDATIANPIATPSQTTDYILTVTSADGCIDRDTVTITVIQTLAQQVTTSPDTTICEGDVIQLFAYGSSDVLQYTWDNAQAGLTCYQGCNNPFAAPTTTTTYYVTLYTSATCYDTDSVEITVVNENQNIIGNDVTICEGDSVQLITTVGTNPIWSPSNNISCVYCPDPYVFPTSTTDYIVETTTATGCHIQDTITITIFDSDLVNAGEDIGTCLGNTVQLNGLGTGLISWSGDNTISDPSILNPTVTPTVNTDYYITVQNGNCAVQDTVTVFLVDGASLEDGEFTICANDPTQIGVEGFATNYAWTATDGLDDATVKRPTATLTETTVYTVNGTIPGCPSDDATITVNVIDVTTILPDAIQNVFEGQPTAINLTDEAQNPNLEFIWTPNLSISCDNCNAPLVTLSTTQTYNVQITDIENGCIGLDSVELRVVSSCDDGLVIVPNAFSPNDDGLNDLLYVRGSTLDYIYTFKIYSRTGELVFETKNMGEGWDGTYNGEKLNGGVYVYYVEAPCALNNSVILKTGNVLLIR